MKLKTKIEIIKAACSKLNLPADFEARTIETVKQNHVNQVNTDKAIKQPISAEDTDYFWTGN